MREMDRKCWKEMNERERGGEEWQRGREVERERERERE